MLGDFSQEQLSSPGDSASFAYYLTWNLHALTSGLDPFFTPNLYAPDGLDIGNAISIPSVSILVAPVTWLFGGTVAFNVAVILSIVLCALSVYLLSHELFRNRSGALLAGLIASLSPYFAGHILGHLNLMWIFGLPLLAYLVARAANKRLRRRWLILGVALIVVFTLGASTELFVTESLFAGAALVIALAVGSAPTRTRLVRLLLPIGAGYVAGVALGLPVIFAALRSGVPSEPVNPPSIYVTEFTNLFIPTEVTAIGGNIFTDAREAWLAGASENTAYIPITLIVLMALVLRAMRERRPLGIAVFAVVSLVASFGPLLMVNGKWTIPMPWGLIVEIPLIDHALPMRFSAFTFMALAVLVAYLWSTRRPRRVITGALALATCVLLIPTTEGIIYPVQARDPEFVTSGQIDDYVQSGDNVLVLPAGQWGPGMRWVAESDFRFTTPTGNGGGAALPAALRDPTGVALYVDDFDYDFASTLPTYLAKYDVDTILVPEEEANWKAVVDGAITAPGELHGGVWVYELGPSHQSPR
ncbi:MAG: hypothetical protein EPO52_03265 [Herbiconiux sp.]|uniref:glycosyltransferase family 39 protein n=1 Tax=Herbiconiux sp. TaxID=1871186 RepID=UPI0012089F8C|nr:glycosyltransferase family 39 protein [Herbiconiux sp.]TAJ49307.1 MAG: hypothetical protein EPO52_03265 [Herbiconiux sp.]